MNGVITITIIFFIMLMSVFNLIVSLARNTTIARDIRNINHIFGDGWLETKLPGLVGIRAFYLRLFISYSGKKNFIILPSIYTPACRKTSN